MAGDSVLDSVRGLSASGDCINLLARIGFPAACFMAREFTSFEIEDLIEDTLDGTLLRRGVEGVSGWSPGVGRPNLAVKIKVEP